MKTYKSSLASYPRMVTSLGVLALALLAFASLAVFAQTGFGSSFFVSVAAVVGIGAAMYLFYRKSLSHLTLGAEELIVHKRKDQISIPVKEIMEVKIIKGRRFKMASSSYGLFGFMGVTRQGDAVLVNDFNHAISVTTSAKTYYLSCDNPEKFERDFRALS